MLIGGPLFFCFDLDCGTGLLTSHRPDVVTSFNRGATVCLTNHTEAGVTLGNASIRSWEVGHQIQDTV